MVEKDNDLAGIYRALRHGRMSRRAFVVRAAALGASAPLSLMLVNSVSDRAAAAQTPPAERPTVGTDDLVRGAGGELWVRQWFAPSYVVAHLTDFLPQSVAQISSMILEPLLSYAPDGSLLPTLATEVPSKKNGGLSDDLTTVTLNLRDDVLWSDGEPFTADDVVWTWQWVTDESTGAPSRWVWSEIQTIEATSPTQVRIVYAKPTLGWFFPIAGAGYGGIVPRHIWAGKEKAVDDAAFAIDPIGTGPYKIETVAPGEQIVCSINERYREPNKPYFETVRFQAGGDGTTDFQAVLQDGDGDVAAILSGGSFTFLKELAMSGGKGRLVAGPPTELEQIVFNFSDPNTEVDGERSNLHAPHPFLTDRAVRQAMTMAIDREAIASDIFLGGDIHVAARNVLTGIPALESPNTSLDFDIDAANDLLDRAGWKRVGDTRSKNGIELAVSYVTTGIGDLSRLVRYRQRTQIAIKAGWEAIGIQVELGQVSASDFFTVTPDNELSFAHFYRDTEMFTNGLAFPLPDMYFSSWYAGPDNSNIAQRANDWLADNIQRYIDPAFDLLYEEATSTIDPVRAAELFIQMNDHLVENFVVVPLVAQPGGIYALANRIADDNISLSSWEPLFWNIANWHTVDLSSELA
jgi:peptide/nickel transport system substrate-binding protein